jgi:hypothetical protein
LAFDAPSFHLQELKEIKQLGALACFGMDLVENTSPLVRFEVFTAVTMKNGVF